MAPRINESPRSNQGISSFGQQKEFSLGNAAIGSGQVFSVRDELLLPKGISPKVSTLRAWLPRLGGAATTLATLGYDMFRAVKRDQDRGDDSLRDSRRQFFSSMSSITAGFGVGTVAGGAASLVIALGAPLAVGAGVTAVGVGGAIFAAKYTYDWANEFAQEWIN